MSKINRTKKLSDAELSRLSEVGGKLKLQNSISFEQGLDALVRRCVNKGLQDITIKFYKNELKVFRYYLALYNEAAIEDINKLHFKDIEKFIDYLKHERNSSVGNINVKLKALKTFLRVNNIEHLAKLCTPLSDEKYKVQAFTTEEVRKLLNSCDLTTYIGIRDYTIMLTFADAGIRVKELSNLTVNDFNKNEHSLFIREAKNGYSRYAPISKEVVKMIDLLISLNSENDYIFQSLQGNQLSRVAIQRRVQLAGRRAKLSENTRCSPHTFRHYYAKTMIENGANVFELQKLLGHRSLEMVRVYVNLYDKEIYKAHKQYSPMNNINI